MIGVRWAVAELGNSRPTTGACMHEYSPLISFTRAPGWANFAPHRVGDATGNAEFATPNLAALAGNGTLLDRLYGHKFCGPSRAAIQSGRLPIHVNVLDAPLDSHNPQDAQGGFFGIPRNMTGIAAKLKSAQYST